jgi:negative regulator of sigma E activity
MVNPRIPDDRVPNDPYMGDTSGMPPRTPERLDADLQPDPELAEGRSSTGRVAAFAVGIAILLAAVFYGLNNSSTGNNQASNPPPTKAAQTQPANPADNTSPGVTTGAATNRPAPLANTPTGTEVDHSAPPPAGKNNNPN